MLAAYGGNVWAAFAANFGRKMTKMPGHSGSKWAVFICLLAGSIMWIYYRASLTSKLSVEEKVLPFSTLSELADSPYRLGVPSRGHAYGEIFANHERGTIYEKVFENNMDSNSFFSMRDGLNWILEEPQRAYFQLLQATNAIKEFHCKVYVQTYQEYLENLAAIFTREHECTLIMERVLIVKS